MRDFLEPFLFENRLIDRIFDTGEINMLSNLDKYGKISLFLLIIILSPLVFAQDQSPNSSSDSTPSRTDVIFVPYDKMTGPQFGKDKSVLIPYAEFLRLKDAAREEPEFRKFPPVGSLVQSAYKGTIVDNVARFEARLDLEVLARAKDRLEISLPFRNLAIESASIEGPSSSIVPMDNNTGLRLIFLGEGKRTVNLRLAVPLQTDESLKRLDFHIPRSAASSVELKIRDDMVMVPQPVGIAATVTSAEGGETTILFSPGSDNRVYLVFKPRVDKTGAAAQTRFTVNQDLSFDIASRFASLQIILNVAILTGSMDSLTIEIPQGLQLRDISGPFVKDWTPPDQGKCTIALSRALTEAFTIQMNALMDLPSSSEIFPIPQFRIPEAVGEAGVIRLKPGSGLALWIEESSGVEHLSESSQADLAMRRYRFEQPGWKLLVSKEPIPPRLRSEGIILYEVTEQIVRLRSRHHITVAGSGIFNIIFTIPEGYELREAGPSTIVSGFRQQERQVEINLKGEQRAPMDIDLHLQRPRSPDEKQVALEPLVITGAEEDSGSVVLSTPRALSATEILARDLESTDVRNLLKKIGPLQTPELVPVLGYRYFTSSFHAVAAIERQRTRLSCQTSRLISIMPSLMRIDATLEYNVEFSATDSFQLLLPASVGEDVRFQGADIKEKFHAPLVKEGLVDNELTTWTVRLQRRYLGPYSLRVSFDVPLPGSDMDKTLTIDIPKVRAAGVVREIGFIAVSRGENLEVRIAKSEGLEVRDTKELPPQLSSAFLGFRYFDPAKHFLKLELVRHELETVLGALIRRMHIESVLNDQRQAVHELILEVQNNREQYLELILPDALEIWSAFVRGVPVRPITRQSDGARLIELTKSESRDTAFRVRLILRETLPGGPLKMTGSLVFDPIKRINIPVLRTTWKLYLPRGYDYIDFGGTMRLEEGGRPSWIEPASGKLLNDIPASLAGGVARPSLNPPIKAPSASYNTTETEEEKKARLQGEALDIPIVREGAQFVFSKLSGIGTIKVQYWKKKPLVILQGAVGIILFLMLLGFMRLGKRPHYGLVAFAIFFIGASLTGGLPGRLFATSYAVSFAAFLVSLSIFLARRIHLKKQPAEPLIKGYPPGPPYQPDYKMPFQSGPDQTKQPVEPKRAIGKEIPKDKKEEVGPDENKENNHE